MVRLAGKRTSTSLVASVTVLGMLGALGAAQAGAATDGPLHLKVSSKKKLVTAAVTHEVGSTSFVVRLNGRDITDRFADSANGLRGVVLGAGEGLRFGSRNVLSARISYPGAESYSVKKRFRVKLARPLPSAGPDLAAKAGDTVRLDGSRSRARARGKPRRLKLRYRWTLARAPQGSSAKLSGRKRKRPALVTDVIGTYLVKLAVRSPGGRPRTDLVSVEAGDPTYAGNGLVVQSYTAGGFNGPTDGIRVYSGAGAREYQNGGGLLLLALDDVTLEPLVSVVVSESDGSSACSKFNEAVTDAETLAGQLGHDPLVFVSGVQPQAMATCGAAIASATGTNYSNDYVSEQKPISAVGQLLPAFSNDKPSPCTEQVTGWRACPGFLVLDDSRVESRLSGMLTRNALGHYVFQPVYDPSLNTSTVQFDTRAPASTATTNQMKVGNLTFDSDPLGGATGGFHLVMIDGRSGLPYQPGFFPAGSATYLTNGSGQDAQNVDALRAVLEAVRTTVETNPQYRHPTDSILIFLQGFGTPAATNLGTTARYHAPLDANDELKNEWFGLGNLISEFGGSRNAINDNKSLWATDEADGMPGYAVVTSTLYRQPTSQSPRYLTSTPVTRTEASGDVPGANDGFNDLPVPVRITGTLQRDALWQLEPLGSQGDSFAAPEPGTETLASLAYGVDTEGNPSLLPTPFPHQDDPEWVAARQYAAQFASAPLVYDPSNPGNACYRPPGGKSDIRSNYCGDDPGLAAFQNALSTMDYPAGQPFSERTWDLMKAQIDAEIDLVLYLEARTSFYSTLYTASSNTQPAVDLKNIATYINNTIIGEQGNGLAGAQASSIVDIFAEILWGLGPIDVPDLPAVSVFITEAAASSGLTSALLGWDGGSDAPPFGELTIQELTDQLQRTLGRSGEAMGTLRDLIAADWGKLRRVGTLGSSGVDPNTDDAVRKAVTRTLSLSGARASLGTLLRATYTPVGYPCPVSADFNTFDCPIDPDLGNVNDGCWRQVSQYPSPLAKNSVYVSELVGVSDATDPAESEVMRPYALVKFPLGVAGPTLDQIIPPGTLDNVSKPVSTDAGGIPEPFNTTVGTPLPNLGLYQPFVYGMLGGGPKGAPLLSCIHNEQVIGNERP